MAARAHGRQRPEAASTEADGRALSPVTSSRDCAAASTSGRWASSIDLAA
jgi:hypothetical protein